jgi:hypothetical protein
VVAQNPVTKGQGLLAPALHCVLYVQQRRGQWGSSGQSPSPRLALTGKRQAAASVQPGSRSHWKSPTAGPLAFLTVPRPAEDRATSPAPEGARSFMVLFPPSCAPHMCTCSRGRAQSLVRVSFESFHRAPAGSPAAQKEKGEREERTRGRGVGASESGKPWHSGTSLLLLT